VGCFLVWLLSLDLSGMGGLASSYAGTALRMVRAQVLNVMNKEMR
jgi:hypothetical protein